MGVTKRLVLVILICAALTVCAGLFGSSGWAVAAFVLSNLTAAILYVTDVLATPKKDALEVSRVLDDKLSLSAETVCTVTVRNRSDEALRVRVTDDLPEFFHCERMPEEKEIPAHAFAEFSYTFVPVKRGEYTLPRITVRYTGVYGLCTRQFSVATDQKYRVYPNMRDLSVYNISSLSRHLFLNGLKPVRLRADSGEFDSLRQYAEGDSFRSVNWAVTARRGELTVNTFTPERNQFVYVMLDASRVMNTKYRGIMMLDWCINAAFLLMDYVLRGGDNLGMMTFSAGVDRFVRAGKGSGQLETVREMMYNAESREDAADYGGATAFLSANVKRRSLIFVFTDLFNEEEAIRFAEAAKTNLKGHLVCAVTVRDPRIAEIARGNAQAKEDVYLRSAAIKTEADRKKISRILQNAGILHVDSDPDRLSLSAVAAYLNVKRQGIL